MKSYLYYLMRKSHRISQKIKREFRIKKRQQTQEPPRFPEFSIIGEMKAGTTALYNYLIIHPNVMGAITKEIRFFNQYYHKGPNWYRYHFPSNKRRKYECITGEATPGYFFHPLAPRRISEQIPDIKLILLLRNPIDRALSHYYHNLKHFYNIEQLTFEQAFEMEKERLKYQKELIIQNNGGLGEGDAYAHYSYFERGKYINQLKYWLQIFRRDQIYIISTERLHNNTEGVIKDIFKFLNLPEYKIDVRKKFNVGNYPRIKPNLRRRLLQHFEPYNRELYDFLNMDFKWK